MNVNDLLNSSYAGWMEADKGLESDIVISSRIRLARNLRMKPFPHLLDANLGQEVIAKIKSAWEKTQLDNFELVTFDQITALERQILMEKHLISPDHAKVEQNFQGLLVNADGSIAIMINEEDHLRIQCMLPGLQIEQCYQKAQEIDDLLEANLDFAFDERRGYLTSCPTNVGTGMRASVMVHLPALSLSGQANRIFQNISQLGMTVRGLYGEHSEVLGNFYQISNQVTLGQSEEDIISNLTSIVEQIVKQERLMRQRLQEEMKLQLDDRVGRAYGLLTNAKIMTSSEALKLLSDVRLGVDMGLVQDIKPFALNQLVVAIRPAHLQKKTGQAMDAAERDIERAAVIKEKLVG